MRAFARPLDSRQVERVARSVMLALAFMVPALRAQPVGGPGTRVRVPERALTVAHASTPIVLDATLREPFWRAADSLSDLRQREPVEGAPATERTVVKVARDQDAFYVAVRAYVERPDEIRATQLRRDTDLSADNNITVLIDSFHDRRSAFVFRTNPNGAMWDAQFIGVDNLNVNWNGIWNVAASRDSAGWTAEFRIPFRTLRFDAETNGTFGFNVRRFIRHKNEETLWGGWGRAEGIYQLLAEGDLIQIGPLERTYGLEWKPYVLGRAVEPSYDDAGTRVGNGTLDAKAGLDVKIGLTPTLTADFTVNTDFAQAEADRQVINLTRFPLFFPEKRDFFLESSGMFDFGFSDRARLFYSRRIGLTADGAPVPILAGARITGRAGAWTLGLLDARTGAGDDANDLVVRVKHDLLARSYVGALFGEHAGPATGGVRRAVGVDLDLPLVVRGYNIEPTIWIAATQTPGIAGTPVAWRVATDFPNDLWDNFVSLYSIDAGYQPPLGFVRRAGIRETTGHFDFQPRPHRLGIRRLDIRAPIPDWDIIADRSGSLTDSRTWQTATFGWGAFGGTLENGDSFSADVQRQMDAPPDSFTVYRGVVIPSARYWWTRYSLQYEMSPARALSLSPNLSWGHFYDGTSTEVSLSATWRSGGHLILGSDVSWNDVRLPGGSFTAVQTAARIEYALTTRADFLAFVQFNNEERRADFNLRFHWTPIIGDDLYVVWNSGYSTANTARNPFPSARALSEPLNGAIVVKASWRLAR